MSTIAIPAMANAHSHAFQRALRGRADRPGRPGDDFWSWREAMLAVAGTLEPDGMRRIALGAYREMRAAGYGAVGEFHYVHHRRDGTPYEEPNAMAIAVAEAAVEAGLPIVLLPAAYHEGGHARFADADVRAFLSRVDGLLTWSANRAGVDVGIAAHSVRAVPPDWLEAVAAYADEHKLVRHVHASEQPREVEWCRERHGCSPIALLERTGFLGPRASVVHAIHVDRADIALLARSGAAVVSCPTTEANLGDGWPPALAFRDARIPLAVGSDSQTRIDPFEEVRELEGCARRAGGTRHALLAEAGDLWAAVAAAGAASLGIPDAGQVQVDLEHPDLRGIEPGDLPYALATCASAAVVAP